MDTSKASMLQTMERKTRVFLQTSDFMKAQIHASYEQALLLTTSWHSRYEQALLLTTLWHSRYEQALLLTTSWHSRYEQALLLTTSSHSRYEQALLLTTLWHSRCRILLRHNEEYYEHSLLLKSAIFRHEYSSGTFSAFQLGQVLGFCCTVAQTPVLL